MEGDRDLLLRHLDQQRDHVLGILDGLPDDLLLRPVLPSGWHCLGLVRHLTFDVERFWFQEIAAGQPVDDATAEDGDDVWRVPAAVTGAEVFGRYRREIERANDIIAATDLDAPPKYWPEEQWPDWSMTDLRAIVLHVITETACHAGHLDAARELLDGRLWLVL
jgi:Protein of unknown function (DUF664)